MLLIVDKTVCVYMCVIHVHGIPPLLLFIALHWTVSSSVATLVPSIFSLIHSYRPESSYSSLRSHTNWLSSDWVSIPLWNSPLPAICQEIWGAGMPSEEQIKWGAKYPWRSWTERIWLELDESWSYLITLNGGSAEIGRRVKQGLVYPYNAWWG